MANKVDGIHHALVGNIDVKIAEIHELMRAMTAPTTSPSVDPVHRRDTMISLTETLVSNSSDRSSTPQDGNKRVSKLAGDVSLAGHNSSCNNDGGSTWPIQKQSNSRDSSETDSPKSRFNSPIITPYETPPTVFAESIFTVNPPKSSHMSPEAHAIPTLNLP